MTVDTNKSLVDNIHALNRQETLALFKNFNKPVDKTTWAAPSYVVNAQYDTYSNSILFPAAILNQPLYSEKQSEAQNYGAIGMVIGHEITHAFDSNGARFDKEGNLSNWWTDADRKAFEKKLKLWLNSLMAKNCMVAKSMVN
ncbi:hypothetical protein N1496_06995 [Streptococcus didelphis]|uniref:Peptidase M13 C-terminal domain-containing protein n=1 Tax=Streptococcus didelphis TaxID=102886 RepID=A0ABY9LIW9_9STRE|nr:hypothetical protein N1496_06995 [Streptococcus didelphis]